MKLTLAMPSTRIDPKIGEWELDGQCSLYVPCRPDLRKFPTLQAVGSRHMLWHMPEGNCDGR